MAKGSNLKNGKGKSSKAKVKKGVSTPAGKEQTMDALRFDRMTSAEVSVDNINPGGPGFGPVTPPYEKRTNLR